MKEFTFEEFIKKVREVYEKHMEPRGYKWPVCGIVHYDDWYSVEFVRNGVFTIEIHWYKNYDGKPAFELCEHFCEFENIPKEYGDMHDTNKDWEQVPMFIYGVYRRFADALKSLVKGDSFDLRPYKELYY